MTDRWRARWLLLGLAAAVTLPAAAWAQTPPAAAGAPPIEYPAAARHPTGRPPRQRAAGGASARSAAACPAAARHSAAAATRGPGAGNVPTTWGPTEPEESVVEAASRGPIARPVCPGRSGWEQLRFRRVQRRRREAVPTFVGVLGIGDGLLGLDLGTFATSATRAQRQADSPVDRVAVDLFGVVRPAALHRRDDRSFEMRVLHSLAAELGLGLERADAATSRARAS